MRVAVRHALARDHGLQLEAFTPALLSKWLLVITYVVCALCATFSIRSFQPSSSRSL